MKELGYAKYQLESPGKIRPALAQIYDLRVRPSVSRAASNILGVCGLAGYAGFATSVVNTPIIAPVIGVPVAVGLLARLSQFASGSAIRLLESCGDAAMNFIEATHHVADNKIHKDALSRLENGHTGAISVTEEFDGIDGPRSGYCSYIVSLDKSIWPAKKIVRLRKISAILGLGTAIVSVSLAAWGGSSLGEKISSRLDSSHSTESTVVH